jgi:hypothetical protein
LRTLVENYVISSPDDKIERQITNASFLKYPETFGIPFVYEKLTKNFNDSNIV